MGRILRRASWRQLRLHPWQAVLMVVGVALGVAVVVAIDVANDSAQRAFARATTDVTGRATHWIVGGTNGLPEELYRELRVDRGRRDTAPVVEGYVESGERLLRVLGVDPFAEAPFRDYARADGGPEVDLGALLTLPGAVIANRATVERLGLAPGDLFTVEGGGVERTLRLLSIIEEEEGENRAADLLIADLSTAQEVLGLTGRLTRIDLLLPEADDAALADWRSSLPPETELVRSSSRTAAAEQMTRAFRLNLSALSLLALLCGCFLIYNTVSFGVVQRRHLLATLRCLGATRAELFRQILFEALVVGGVGTLVGGFGGYLLGERLLELVSRTINDLYYVVDVRQAVLAPATAFKAVAAGLGAALVATLAPAWEATTVQPRAALARSEIEQRSRGAAPILAVCGAALALLGAGLIAVVDDSVAVSFVGLFAILMGCALPIPWLTMVLMRGLTPVAGRLGGQLGRYVPRGVTAALSRTAVAVAALMMAVAVAVGVDLMIGSFRGTVTRWLDYSLQADLYVTLPTSIGRRFQASATLPPDAPARLAAAEGVEWVDSLRHFELLTESGRVRAVAANLDPRSQATFAFKRGDPARAWEALRRGEGLWVSEPYAYRHDLALGAPVRFESPAGARELPVAGIFYDYGSEQGLVMIGGGLYRELWGDAAVTALGVYATPGIDLEALAETVRRTLAPQRALVASNRELRESSMVIFDRTFAITGVLRLLAVIVAFIGVLSALMALQLEREREIGVLRACGLTPRQVWALVTGQTGLLGLTAGLLAVPLGFTMAAIMIYVINQRSFGWSLDLAWSASTPLEAVALAVGAALLAGLYPAWRMARVSPAAALRGE